VRKISIDTPRATGGDARVGRQGEKNYFTLKKVDLAVTLPSEQTLKGKKYEVERRDGA